VTLKKLQHLGDFEAALAAVLALLKMRSSMPIHIFRKWEGQRQNFEAGVIDYKQTNQNTAPRPSSGEAAWPSRGI
jgi:hypothetical protein